MKRLVILLSVVAVLLAGIATTVIILRARARTAPAAEMPAPSSNTGANGRSSAEVPAGEKTPQGILPREQDAPPRLSADAQGDADGDGLIDGEEAALRTDPKRKDTDGDGLSDLDEVRSYCTDPREAMTDGKTKDSEWVAARREQAAAAGQRPSFCVE